MSDERGRGAADDERRPATEPDGEAQEPEIGTSEWLLQQLTGGRRVGRRSAERDAESAASVPEPEPASSSAPAHEPVLAPDEGRSSADGVSAAPDDTPSEPAAFDELLARAVAEEPPAPEAPVPSQTEFPVTFNWNLTPGEGGDPLVETEPELEPDGDADGRVAAFPPFEASAPVPDDPVEPEDAPSARAGSAPAETPASEPEEPEPIEPQTDGLSLFDALIADDSPGDVAPTEEDDAEPPAAPSQPDAGDTTPPAAYRTPLFEPSTPTTEAEPPTVETPTAAGSWVIPPVEPPQPAAPERPRTIFDPPPAQSPDDADDESDERGHGLAALLGFGQPEEPEHSGRSIIGDTTSIIPLVPGAVPPPSTAPTAPTEAPSGWAGSHKPDPWFEASGHREPAAPTNPVLPPIDAAALFEPATDTPAHRAAAPDLDAALRSESRPASPTLPSEHSLPQEAELADQADVAEPASPAAPFTSLWPTAEAEPFDDSITRPAAESEDGIDAADPFASLRPATEQERPDGSDATMGEESPQTEVPDWSAAASAVLSEPTQALPTVLPSEPDIPAAEAEVALGGVPSPATSPIDAASIAAAAEVASEPAGPADPAADDRHDEADDESDGLALLFGDVAPIDHEADEEPASGSSETGDETDGGESPTSGDDLFRASEEEPAAALEGPQLTPTVPFVFPPESPIDTDEADGIDDPSDSVTAEAPVVDAPQDAGSAWPPVAGAGAAADGSAVTAGSAAPDAAGSSASSTPVTAATSPSAAAAPAAPGLWDTRNNRILFSVAGGLAIVLVLIGLFALGTRIPSLFGAAKPAPAPTASATPVASPTPTPTPVPTVTPKPGAAVGAGTHPWDALGGGECIQPFTSVWAQEFTVVDCAAPHTAQLVYTNVLSADPAAPYPGADALAGQIPGLCTASGVVDLGAAGAYPDLQVIGSFPATEQQWKDGQRSYYCFVDRSGGEPLTSSVAGPGPTG